MRASAAGTKRTGVRQQREQRDLPDVGAFARHVRPGDEQSAEVGSLSVDSDARPPNAASRIIRHEAFLRQRFCSSTGCRPSRITQHAFVADLRAAIIEQPRRFGERRQHVELRQRGGGLLDLAQLPQHFFAHAQEQFVFQLHAAFFRAEDFAFHLLQLRRDEPLAVGDGLLADVMRRHLVEVRLRDFDVIAEDGIEPHLERRDAGASRFPPAAVSRSNPCRRAWRCAVRRAPRRSRRESCRLPSPPAAVRPRWRGAINSTQRRALR